MLQLVIALLLLHAPDGAEIRINPEQVTSMHSRHATNKNSLFSENVGCLIRLSGGKFVTVAEDCRVIEKLLEQVR